MQFFADLVTLIEEIIVWENITSFFVQWSHPA